MRPHLRKPIPKYVPLPPLRPRPRRFFKNSPTPTRDIPKSPQPRLTNDTNPENSPSNETLPSMLYSSLWGEATILSTRFCHHLHIQYTFIKLHCLGIAIPSR